MVKTDKTHRGFIAYIHRKLGAQTVGESAFEIVRISEYTRVMCLQFELTQRCLDNADVRVVSECRGCSKCRPTIGRKMLYILRFQDSDFLYYFHFSHPPFQRRIDF